MTHEDIGRCSLPSPRVDFNDRSWNRSTMCVIIFNALTTSGGNAGKVIEVLLGHIRRRRRRYRLGKTIHSCAEFLENSGQRYYRPLGVYGIRIFCVSESYYFDFNTYRDNNNFVRPTVRTNRVNRTNIQSEIPAPAGSRSYRRYQKRRVLFIGIVLSHHAVRCVHD